MASTLDEQPALTVFAPTDAAFALLPVGERDRLLADRAALTRTLAYHVLPERLAPEQLAGRRSSLLGSPLDILGAGESFTVNGAGVVCGNLNVGNATIYVIDKVLAPPR